jgi:putative membrane protein
MAVSLAAAGILAAAARPGTGEHMKLINKEGRERVSAAIETVERKTSGEIVAVVAAESSSYLHIPFMYAALIALIVPWPFIHYTWMSVHWIWALQLLAFAVLVTVMMSRNIRYRLVPSSTKQLAAHRRAVEQFLTQNLHTTEGRTGVLIFVSVAERYAEILADSGIHKKVPKEDWVAIVNTLTDRIGDGQAADGFVTAVEAVGERLAKHFPAGSADPSKLPNHLIVLE